ncbi:efflux RND transporter permease subunit [Cohaesibacter celericrescens]|uniref:Multidrug transporter AcrB n=1 Tax=Cohaesibacter celericrescens TaxID=2067669 RepID=A0A2N5XPV9_9HYPH|nr:efflux RND transporter permease subunit [Cohaesibacter celericrescens]PLW76533.1 multidrug transporter AcrB [Cohaesibacter celericrescens]
MNLAKFAIEKRVISALSTILILFLGYYAYTLLPRFEDPEFIIRQAQVITPYPGATASDVEKEITDVIENAVQQLAGVKEVKSVSTPGLSEVTVEFTIQSTKSRLLLQQKFAALRAKISDAAGNLPPNAIASTVYDDFGDVYALYYAITGEGFSLTELKSYAEDLQKELVLVPGVSKVLLSGDPNEVVYLEYNPSQLTQLGLSSDRIAQLLEGQDLVTSAGSIETGSTRTAIRLGAGVPNVEALGEIYVNDSEGGQSFRLKDIATITRGTKEPEGKRLYRNSNPAIALGISNTQGGNVVKMGEAVKARLAELQGDLPLGIELTPISDQATSVKASVDDFVMNVILALVIVVGTLLIFMGIRSGLLMGGILLITIAGTLFGMWAFGLDMQRISLGALIIALGMLVDNAIVVVESTLVRIQKGEDTASAAISVVEQTKWPLLGGTVVGFLAFSAIGFSPDNTGEYAGSLFWTVTIALLFSWLTAVWLTPYFCTLLLKPSTGSAAPKKEHKLLGGYRKILKLAVELRWITVALVIGLFVSSIVAFSSVKQGFFPASTRAQFVVDYNLPASSTEFQVTEDLEKIGSWIRELDGVTGTNSVVGGGHLRFMLTYSAESGNTAYGQVLVDVTDYTVIEDLIPTIKNHIEATYPSSLAKVWKFVLGPGGGSAIAAKFSGPDPSVLRALSEEAKSVLRNAGAVAVKDDWGDMTKTLAPKINEQAAQRVGLTRGDIAKAIAEFFDGKVIGIFREEDELLQIVFRPYEVSRNDIQQIENVQIFSSVSGKYIPITQVVSGFSTEFENPKLRRVNRQLAIIPQADPAPGVNATSLFTSIRPQIEAIDLPSGYSMEWKGQFGDSQEANAGLASTLPFGIGAMVVVVILLFNAVKQPLIIWLTVPLAIIGVVYGLIAFGTPMEFMGILAILSLTGMLIKNAIVLIDETDFQISDGKARMDAIIDAAVSRVRPVSLGVLTTVLGVVPLLWDPFFKSLSVVIICGLSFATILTLIVVPVLYAIFFRIGNDEILVSQ